MKTALLTEDYHAVIVADISVEEAFENITHVWEWWAINFDGSSENLNDVFTVRFGDTFVTFKVVELNHAKKMVWEVIDCNLHWLKDKKEWNGTTLEWEISTKGKSTQMRFTHVGLIPGIECYNDCKKGWDFYITESLLKLITERKGLPETPKDKR